jgi:hypothetical protein
MAARSLKLPLARRLGYRPFGRGRARNAIMMIIVGRILQHSDLKAAGGNHGRCNFASSPIGLDWVDLRLRARSVPLGADAWQGQGRTRVTHAGTGLTIFGTIAFFLTRLDAVAATFDLTHGRKPARRAHARRDCRGPRHRRDDGEKAPRTHLLEDRGHAPSRADAPLDREYVTWIAFQRLRLNNVSFFADGSSGSRPAVPSSLEARREHPDKLTTLLHRPSRQPWATNRHSSSYRCGSFRLTDRCVATGAPRF